MYSHFLHLFLLIVAVSCTEPRSPSHGSRSGDDFTFGKTVSYQCDPGYKITGSRTRTCTASGTWSGNQPSCKGKNLLVLYWILLLLFGFSLLKAYINDP